MKNRLVSFFLVFLLICSNVSFSYALGTDDETKGSIPPDQRLFAYEDNGEAPPKPDGMELARKRDKLSPSQRKLDTELLQIVVPDFIPSGKTKDELIEEKREKGQLSTGIARNGSAATLANVYIQLQQGASLDEISSYVTEVTNSDKARNLIVAKVDINKLESLAGLQSVKSVRLVLPPIIRAGSAQSEGDAMHRANLARLEGDINGAGVKVGIISDGVDHIADAVASGDLPPGVTVLSNSQGGDEGTAMLEIVHDLAPGAQLYFHDCGNNTLAFNQAIDNLVNAGCDIVCDDIGWILEPYYEDGVVAGHLNDLLLTHDVLYTSSAGNDASSHYQGQFYDNGYGFSDFSHGTSSTPDLYAHIPPNGYIIVVLQWDEPFGDAGSDYDLYMTSTDYAITYSGSTYEQNGDDDPLEYFQYINTTGADINVAIFVDEYSATTPRNLEIYMYTGNGAGNYINNIVEADSIFGHPAVPGAISCGAIRHSAPNTIEFFSSQGPVTMLSETRQKPDICGADGVDVTGAGGFSDPFYGTSAAAPHVAAVAALLMSKYPEKSVEQIKQYIVNGVVDLGDPGYDAVYGNGRIDAYNSMFFDSYTVRFISQGGSSVPSVSTPHNTAISEPAAPTRSGHSFAGWFKESDCTDDWIFSSDIVTANITLYAAWAVNSYTVTFDSRGGSAVSQVAAQYNTAISPPTAPTQWGYTFAGWYRDLSYATAWNFSTDTVLSDITLYAKWTPVPLVAVTASAQPASISSILVNWTACEGASGYEVYRSASADGYYALVADTADLSYTDGGLALNTSYYYKVRAYRNGSPREYGPESAVVTAKPLPAAPSVTATPASYNSIRVSWGKVAGATKYEVYYATSAAGAYKRLTTTASAGYTHKNVSTGTTYHYKVRAYRLVSRKKIYGSFSEPAAAATALGTPGGLKTAVVSYVNLKISWSKVAGASRYEIYRSATADGGFALVGTSSAASYTLKNQALGTTYYYQVRAYRSVGGRKVYGAFSGTVAGTIPAIVVAAPASITASPATYNSVKVTWAKVSKATKYELYRATSADGPYKLVASTSSTMYTGRSLGTGTEYFFKVRAYRSIAGRKIYGEYSAVASARPVLGTPAGFKARRASATSVKLTWKAVAGATKYEVWRGDTAAEESFALFAETKAAGYTHAGLSTGTTYYYRVRAYRIVGGVRVYGGFSPVVSATP